MNNETDFNKFRDLMYFTVIFPSLLQAIWLTIDLTNEYLSEWSYGYFDQCKLFRNKLSLK